MPLIDQIVAVAVLGGTGGAVAWQTFRAWREFRMQRRALDLLVRSMTEIDDPRRESTPR